ncbi:YfiT family bacillithiol transferase [Paenibacillus algorifonticola]|uniref:YfiT family bacillithiol transferase n=1 Tax=Paenibacillus algorifonticola TaxID=684063 RepID=UPI003D2AE4DF
MDHIRYPIGQFKPVINPTNEERVFFINQIPEIAKTLRMILNDLEPAQINIPYRKDGWTIKQIVHHLADNDMNAYLRFKRALTEEGPMGNSYREDLWAQLSDYENIPIEDSILLIEILHRRFLILLNHLKTEDFRRILKTQVLGDITLDIALQRFVWHNHHHIAQIEAAVKANSWPVWATEPVEIKSPDPAWLVKGTQEVNRLREILYPFGVREIEHMGSTSIPNLPAKPIIDMMAKIKSFNDVEKVIESLNADHWNYVPPELDGHEWRRFFVKVKNDRRDCHLHLMLEDEEHWEKQIKFRNKLREQPNLAEQYAELKRKLAEENREDREAYTEAKTDFIKSILGRV